jgi:predicted RNA-binding Zn-ribbon protein involved in translation (DUF1610 family)
MPLSRAGARKPCWVISALDAPSPTPHLFPVDHAALHPCPQCGARQWFQGVTYYQCEPCGYRDGPTPQDMLAQQQRPG